MKKQNYNDFELHSEKVRSFLGEIPPILVRWGNVIIIAVFFILLMVICNLPFPNSKIGSIFEYIFEQL